MTEKTTPTAGSNSADVLRHNFTTRISLSSATAIHADPMTWFSDGPTETGSHG
jgi:hypothetical protein